MDKQHDGDATPRGTGLHPVTRGVLVAWALGIAQFAYFGLLLGIKVGGG